MKKQPFIQAIVLSVTLVIFVFVTIDQTLPPRPLPASAPETQFSADRAIEHLEVIATEPRLVGTPGYENARDYILDTLAALDLGTEVQSTTAGVISS